MGILLLALLGIALACILGFPLGLALRVFGILGILLGILGALCAQNSKWTMFFTIAIPAFILLLLGLWAGDMTVLDLLLLEI